MNRTRRWWVTIKRWDTYEVRVIEAESEEAAEEIAPEWFENDLNCEHLDGGVNSIRAEEEV